jgi:hypothetical protein
MNFPREYGMLRRLHPNLMSSMNRWRESGLFLLCSTLICLAVFRGAFWGSRILAPMDIAPTIFSKYHYVDPSAGKVPANHYIIDQLTFDLPLQYTIYNAYRHGEIPWWDPYTYAGRPLLADAHVNGTDPIRLLCYLTMPFVPAYNWNLILKSILTGFGMFVLLRHLRFSIPVSLPLAITYQFAGCFALFFSHPWIQASFAYYPLLWTVWSLGSEKPSLRLDAAGAALCALIFYSGNLQSHAYLALFGVSALIGYGFVNRRVRWRVVRSVVLSGIVGAALAAPVIWPQVEYYLNSLRVASFSSPSKFTWLAGLLSFSSIFPWALGTFRTLDIGKVVGINAAGFVVFAGSAAFCLAAIGCWGRRLAEQSGARRMAIALVLAYFVVCSTPLLSILYTRMAPMAVIGLIVLVALGLTRVADRDRPLKKLGWTIAGIAIAVVLVLNVTAFVIYPRVIDRVRALVAAKEQTNVSFDQTPGLRAFQIENLPREISVLNLETSLAFASLLVLAIYLGRRRPESVMQSAVLILNFLPAIFFFSRFIPNQPVVYWDRLVAGGPEQRRVAAALTPGHLRLLEESAGLNEMLFPNNMGHLQQAHAVHGLSALQPASLYHWPLDERPPAELVSDFVYRSDRRGEEAGELMRVTSDGTSRLRCSHRKVAIIAETTNTLTVSIEPGPADQLLRTDTFYPGWHAQLNEESVPLKHSVSPFSTIDLPASEVVSILTYTYRPSHAVATISFAVIAMLFLLGEIGFERFRISKAS